jgi:hypothetical protein
MTLAGFDVNEGPHREYQESTIPCLPSILTLGLAEESGKTEKSSSHGMSMVDWRWAAEKGFWNRQKQCWVEEMGGKAGYLLQRGLKRNRSEFVRQQIELYWFEQNRGRQIALNGTKVKNYVDAKIFLCKFLVSFVNFSTRFRPALHSEC